jgi:hypothetical protein
LIKHEEDTELNFVIRKSSVGILLIAIPVKGDCIKDTILDIFGKEKRQFLP